MAHKKKSIKLKTKTRPNALKNQKRLAQNNEVIKKLKNL